MNVSEFFTWEALGSYAGAILAVWLVTNVLRYVTNFDARWMALAVAAIIQLVVWWAVSDGSIQALVLALLNTFTVYAGAVGVSQITGKATTPDVRQVAEPRRVQRFAATWW